MAYIFIDLYMNGLICGYFPLRGLYHVKLPVMTKDLFLCGASSCDSQILISSWHQIAYEVNSFLFKDRGSLQ